MLQKSTDSGTCVLQLHPLGAAVAIVALAGAESVAARPAVLTVRQDIPAGHRGAPRSA